MRLKDFKTHPDATSGRIGLMAAEMSVFQYGYLGPLMRMASDCDRRILVLGSSQISGVDGHPMSFELRKAQIEAVCGPLFTIIPAEDIDADTPDVWMNYLRKMLRNNNLPDEPTDYYCGSIADAGWYENWFASTSDPSWSDGLCTTYQSATGRRLHIYDRSVAPQLEGRAVRALIEQRKEDWKRYVPARLHRFIEQNYPPHLRMAIRTPLRPEDVPVGTLWLPPGAAPEEVEELKADGYWRVKRTRTDPKAEAARKARDASD